MIKRSEATRDLLRPVCLLAAVGLLVLCASPAGAVPALEMLYGSPTPFVQAEANAMASTGAALYRGGLSAYLNPAFLTAETGWRIDGSFCLDQVHEDRFAPLYDSFESYVRMTAIASNRDHYLGTGFAVAKRVGTGTTPVVLGFSYNDRYDFRYDFEEEIRDPDSSNSPRDRILRERVFGVDGTLKSLSLGVGVEPVEGISGGLGLHYVFGEREQTASERYFFEPDNSYNIVEDWDLSGMNVTLGGRFQVNERIAIGAACEFELEVDGDRSIRTFTTAIDDTVTEKHSLRYPRRIRVGLTYTPRADPRTVFTVDAVFSEWSELEDSVADSMGVEPRLEDTLDMRVGLEHLFYNEVALRFGFRHVDAYADREASRTMFTAGAGAPVADGRISVSVELSKLSAQQDHFFEYDFEPNNWGGFSAPNGAQVEYTQFRVGVGYSRSF